MPDISKKLTRHEIWQTIRAFIRDLNGLSAIGAVRVTGEGEKELARFMISIRPQWATEITETDFYRELGKLPQAKTRLTVSG